ncbi:MAG TPA: sigma 54-interacting transcriptional regulator, partial [Fusibacter sp.]|nr:sigma 54-interacting transcriptional regulator [Fusibacter sp.]
YDVALIKVHQTIKGFIITIKSMEEVMNTVNDMMLDTVTTGFDYIIGGSEALLSAKGLAKKVASSASTVLILGESGTGKELFARAIHHSSQRNQMPFVAINCAAIPDHLLESELFGYEEGAFTGAKRGGKPGKFQLANKGTLFLDEIGDMPLHLQAKLLRALQEKRIDQLGGNKPIDVDVRVIAATHADLEEKVLEGSFRQDLYYRLNVIPIHVPPLRERKDDLLLTSRYLVEKWCGKLQKTIPVMSQGFIEVMKSHDWPGNVRELENAIEYAVNVCDDDVLEMRHLPKRIAIGHEQRSSNVPDVLQSSDIRSIAQLEEEAIHSAMALYGRSGEALEEVAKMLGISRATLYRKIKTYKL